MFFSDSDETEAPVMWLDTDGKHHACQLYLSQSKAYRTVESPKNTQKEFELS